MKRDSFDVEQSIRFWKEPEVLDDSIQLNSETWNFQQAVLDA
jgi:hypothetical protein